MDDAYRKRRIGKTYLFLDTFAKQEIPAGHYGPKKFAQLLCEKFAFCLDWR